MLLTAPEVEATDLSRLKMVIGGSALPRGLAAAAMQRGIDIYAGYGLSGDLPGAELCRGDAGRGRGCGGASQDLALPLVDLRVVDEEMVEQPRDGASTGEVVVRAPWLNAAYLKDEAASEALWRGGIHAYRRCRPYRCRRKSANHRPDEGCDQVRW